jgi:hypothetical protein
MTGSTEPEIGVASPGPPPTRRRDRGVDLVRAAALIRVIIYHATGNFIVLTVIPAMPVMFFLGGTYMEKSLRKRDPVQVVFGRCKRVIVPGFVYVAVTTGVLILLGHKASDVLASLRQYMIPTHGNEGTADHTADWLFSTLWYLRDYVAFALLSPVLTRLLRAWPRITLACSALLVVLGMVGGIADATTAYMFFWLLGMSGLVDPTVDRVRVRWANWYIAAAGLLGGLLLLTPLESGLQGVGAVLAGTAWLVAVTVYREQIHQLGSRARLSQAVDWIMGRAVSIYLWQMIPVVFMIQLVEPVGRRSLTQPLNVVWIIPAAIAGTFALAAIFAPIERWSARS